MSSFVKLLRNKSTDAETKLWSKLRNRQLGCKFRRQHKIDKYVVDFICLEEKLILEIDGSQHTKERDAERTKVIEEQGYTILRFWNNEVLENCDGVARVIIEALNTPHPAQRADLSHKGRGEVAPMRQQEI